MGKPRVENVGPEPKASRRRELQTTTAAGPLPAQSPGQASQAAYTVDEFCHDHRISRVTFYALLKDNRGPRIMKVGSRTLVSREAAAAWRRRMEKASSPAA